MGLPQLNNDVPKYEMTVPSTKQVVKFRPFLVKEQKVLLVAFESKDSKQILSAMLDCLKTCVPGIDTNSLATFDVDYMFTQVRSKSVGETTQLLHACSECNEENEVKVNLQDVNIVTNENWENERNIKLTNDVTIELKYPTYADILKNEALDKENISGAEVVFESIISCLNSVKTETENIMIKDETKEEIERFMNSLTNDQLEKITNLVETMPTLSHAEKYECKKCKHENIIELKGLNDFF
jgi:ribosome-associated protein YbcJ (S4-like RNA binding protein)